MKNDYLHVSLVVCAREREPRQGGGGASQYFYRASQQLEANKSTNNQPTTNFTIIQPILRIS